MLAHLIDELNDPDPARRPTKAGHVAKALRVFLAADEERHEARAEEHLVVPGEHAARAAAEPTAVTVEGEVPDEAAEEETPTPHRHRRHRRHRRRRVEAPPEGAWGKTVALWQEVRPETRDLLFLASGMLTTLVLIFLGELLTGLRLGYLAGLITGAAVTYVVELFLRWRREEALPADQETVRQAPLAAPGRRASRTDACAHAACKRTAVGQLSEPSARKRHTTRQRDFAVIKVRPSLFLALFWPPRVGFARHVS